MTGQLKVCPDKRSSWPDIVRWPANILSLVYEERGTQGMNVLSATPFGLGEIISFSICIILAHSMSVKIVLKVYICCRCTTCFEKRGTQGVNVLLTLRLVIGQYYWYNAVLGPDHWYCEHHHSGAGCWSVCGLCVSCCAHIHDYIWHTIR